MAAQGTHTEPTCDHCFFRQAGLCALPGNTACPTFRTAAPSVGRARRADATPKPAGAHRRTAAAG